MEMPIAKYRINECAISLCKVNTMAMTAIETSALKWITSNNFLPDYQ
jgi:hypothetical protein